MKQAIGKRGRPTDTLIFQMELSQSIELGDNEKNTHQRQTIQDLLYKALENALQSALIAKIQLTKFDAKFLYDMQSKYHLNASFHG
ncbi:hypothetical protein Q5506_24265 [Escherichia coli]|uniref:hypothetical protein n=1 Tax=Enterobacteriaceae TaxID=543 RepID=UPI000B956156|nr:MULTISPECIES: hypothetical protein [Enterobacteriaceae]MBN6614925.1 hypothetical protein [Escherichia coli]MED8085043.1 hypothetical protein [Escherichia coli]OYJ36352.1 hypothetical protein CI736_25395 [Shigella boydii]HAG7744823.1 hypothetical protein [Escherichia coli]HAH1165686.1 hypothetical protein [Escherichia coli]